MVMEFEEFSRQFRQRTTQRMMEFERALAQAQQRVEKAVTPPTATPPQAAQKPPRPQPKTGRGRVQGLLRRS